MGLTVTLRPATDTDFSWLRWLHHAVMREAVERMWGWNESDQDIYFEQAFDPSHRQIIEVDGRDVGVIGIETRADEVFLAEIEIMPEYQNRGIGTGLIRQVLEQARIEGLPVTLQIIRTNRACDLYERLGFLVTETTLTHYRMRW